MEQLHKMANEVVILKSRCPRVKNSTRKARNHLLGISLIRRCFFKSQTLQKLSYYSQVNFDDVVDYPKAFMSWGLFMKTQMSSYAALFLHNLTSNLLDPSIHALKLILENLA